VPSCGLNAADCITDHWCPVLGAWKEPAGWRAPCPVCGSKRGLSVQVKGPRPSWDNKCECDRAEVRAKLAALLPSCVSARYSPKRAVDRDELVGILLDKSLPPNALRVAALHALGLNADEIRAKLGMPKQTWSDAVRILGRNRRSP
jgi:hypothetical protein